MAKAKDTPATDTPATDAPAADTPATDTPATDTPATDTPATDAPVVDPVLNDAPLELKATAEDQAAVDADIARMNTPEYTITNALVTLREAFDELIGDAADHDTIAVNDAFEALLVKMSQHPAFVPVEPTEA